MRRHHLEIVELGRGELPTVRLDVPDDDVGCRDRAAAGPRRASRPSCRRPERRRGRPAGCRSAGGRRRSSTHVLPVAGRVEGEVELEDVHAGVAEDPELRGRWCARRPSRAPRPASCRGPPPRGQPASAHCAPRCAGRVPMPRRSRRRRARACRRRARSRSGTPRPARRPSPGSRGSSDRGSSRLDAEPS